MRKNKLKLALALLFAASFAGNVGPAYAQKFNSAIANPFVFCSAPKPCKVCQPLRDIYEDICANQANASKTEDPDPAPVAPIVPSKPAFSGNRSQILAEIARLKVLWEPQLKISRAAYDEVTRCVKANGRVQDGFCGPELEDFNRKRIPAGETRDEIYRLEELLGTAP